MTDNSITNQASIMAESISQFYKRIESNSPELDITYLKGKAYFNIFSRRCNFGTVQFSYRDFYKVTLIRGEGKLYYADKWIQVDRPALLFLILWFPMLGSLWVKNRKECSAFSMSSLCNLRRKIPHWRILLYLKLQVIKFSFWMNHN